MGLQKTRLLVLLFTLVVFQIHCNGNNELETLEDKIESLYSFSVETITPSELFSNMDEIYLIDTRESSEFKVSRINGALFKSYKKFNIDDISKIPKESKIVLYCTIGYRSEKVGEKLIKSGFKNVFNLYGGIINWVNMGYNIYNDEGVTNQLHVYSDPWAKYLIQEEVEVIIR